MQLKLSEVLISIRLGNTRKELASCGIYSPRSTTNDIRFLKPFGVRDMKSPGCYSINVGASLTILKNNNFSWQLNRPTLLIESQEFFFPVKVKKKFSLISTRLLSACHILTCFANKKVGKLQWMST